MVGPAAGGVIVAALGVGTCFLINGASFLAPLLGSPPWTRARSTGRATPPRRQPHAVQEGLTYVKEPKDILIPLLMMALVGTLAYEVPLLAHETFGLGATGFGLLYAAMGLGSVVTGHTIAGRAEPRMRMRGRVVALCIVAFMGSTPLGGPLIGVIGEQQARVPRRRPPAVGCAMAVVIAVASVRSADPTRPNRRRGTQDEPVTSAPGRSTSPARAR